jgi:hypothetical protein
MLRSLKFCLAIVLPSIAAHSNTPPALTADFHVTVFKRTHPQNQLLRSITSRTSRQAAQFALSCCKVCTVGKACGNTCISRDKTCHVGLGCACNGWETRLH